MKETIEEQLNHGVPPAKQIVLSLIPVFVHIRCQAETYVVSAESSLFSCCSVEIAPRR